MNYSSACIIFVQKTDTDEFCKKYISTYRKSLEWLD